MKATWEQNHAKYRNFVRRLLTLIRQERLELVKASLQDSVLNLSLNDAANDYKAAELLARTSFASLTVYDRKTDQRGQFTIDRDRPPHRAIADHSTPSKYQRIASRISHEFAPGE